MYSNNYNRDPSDGVNVKGVFAPYLNDDETIEWCGQPSTKKRIHGFNVVFGMFFSGFAAFWAFMVFMSGGGAFALFALPFFLAGLYVIFGGGDMKIRKNTYYAVTDQRCIIICSYKTMSFCDYRYSAMTGVNCIDGSVILAPMTYPQYTYTSSGRRSSNNASMMRDSIKSNFMYIYDDAPRVCQMITRHISECEK